MPRRNEEYRPEAPTVAEIAAGLVIERGGAVLLLHELREDRWCLPKGHVDPGESLAQAALREAKEETGIDDLRLQGEIGEVSYRFYSPERKANVHKSCVYFRAAAGPSEVRTEPIFDRHAWEPLVRAVQLVPFDSDRAILEKATPKGKPRKSG